MKNTYEVRGEITAIFVRSPKYGDKETLIDTADLEKAQSIELTWCVSPRRDGRLRVFANVWVSESIKKPITLHRYLMGEPEGFVIDHINGDTLDNRRSSNLRIITSGQNQQNRRGAQRGSRTGVRGVTWSSLRNEYVVEICVEGKRKHFYCKTLEEAKTTAIQARAEHMPYSQEAL